MNNDKKYYFVTSKALAQTIHFLTGLQYLAYDNQKNKGKKIYSFENTQELQEALEKIMDLRKDLKIN